MTTLRVGVQAPAGGEGQLVDIDGASATISSITNASAEAVQYSINSGGIWTTLDASTSVSGVGTVVSGAMRLRKVSSGAYPAPVDIEATFNGAGLTQSEAAAVRDGRFAGGMKTMLFGDSMTDWYHYVISASSASFDTATKVLTVNTSSAHNLWPGAEVPFWTYAYTSLRNQQSLPVATIPTATSFTLQLSEAPAGVPNGALSGTLQYRPMAGHGILNPITMLQMRNGWPLNVVGNAAQSGDTTTGALARLPAALAAYTPALVIMQSLGINDQTYSGADAPGTFASEATTIANNRAIFDMILASGAYLIVGTITPVASGEARGEKTYMDRVVRLNDDIWRYAQGKARMMVYDSYASVIDPTSATGLAVAAYHRSDFIHWSIRGALRVSKLVEPFLWNIQPQTRSTLPKALIESHNQGASTVTSASGSGTTVTVTMAATHRWRAGEKVRVTGMGDAAANGRFVILTAGVTTFTYDAPGLATSGTISGTKIISRSNNIFANNLLATATGGTLGTGITGTAASLMRCDNQGDTTGYTAVASVAANDSGFGNKQVLAITVAGTGAGTTRSQLTVAGTTAYATIMPGNGASYLFEAQVRVKSTAWANTPVSDIRCYLTVTGSDGKIYQSEALYGWDGVEAASLTEDVSWHVRTPPLLVPVGVTVSSSVFLFWIRHPSAISGGATLTMEMARPAVWDVSDYV